MNSIRIFMLALHLLPLYRNHFECSRQRPNNVATRGNPRHGHSSASGRPDSPVPGSRCLEYVGIAAMMAVLLVPAMALVGRTVVKASPLQREEAEMVSAARERSRTWYFPETSTREDGQAWILLYNDGHQTARVTMDFHTDSEAIGPAVVELGAFSDASINVCDFVPGRDLSIAIRSSRPISAESRFLDPRSGQVGEETGLQARSREWTFHGNAALGCDYTSTVRLHNPGDVGTRACLVFHAPGGVVGPLDLWIDAERMLAVDIGDHLSSFDIDTTVESQRPVVASIKTNGKPSPEDLKVRVVAVARAQLGKPYARGGAGPGSFDCSGLTQYCYGAGMGLQIPHGSQAQARCGKPVARDRLMPGDIVGFHGWGHVGIYIGNGQYIHAPHSGDVVRIAPLAERKDFCGAVRP